MNTWKRYNVPVIQITFSSKASVVVVLGNMNLHTISRLFYASGASCSCVAGRVGFCNHVLALMLKICKFTLFSCISTKDLVGEQDEQSSLACMSQLQQWHKKGGGKNIAPQPGSGKEDESGRHNITGWD